MAQWLVALELPCEPKPVFDPIDVIDELSDEFFLIYDESYSAADAEKIKHDLVMTKFVEVNRRKTVAIQRQTTVGARMNMRSSS